MALNNNLYYIKSKVINYKEGDSSLQRNRLTFVVSQEDRFHTVIDEDTLTELANRFLGDSILWYVIADANGIMDPFILKTGISLLIPAVDQLSNSTNQLGVNTI